MTTTLFRTSDTGITLIKAWEGLRLHAYLDGGGVPTIGYGSTKGVKLGMVITAQQADAMLREHITDLVEPALNASITTTVSQNQWDACVCLTYNIGVTAFETSTLLRLLKLSRKADAADQFLRWNKDNGKPVSGLTLRRTAERALFLA